MQSADDFAFEQNFQKAIEIAKTIANNPQTAQIYGQAEEKIRIWQEKIDEQEKANAQIVLQFAGNRADEGDFETAIKVARNIPNTPQTSESFQKAKEMIQEWGAILQNR